MPEFKKGDIVRFMHKFFEIDSYITSVISDSTKTPFEMVEIYGIKINGILEKIYKTQLILVCPAEKRLDKEVK